MAAGRTWLFDQLGGDGKQLYLQGWTAPYGRPRKGTIVNGGVSLRKQETWYPGKGIPPTVHIFGEKRKDFEIHGRWMDHAFAAQGGARAFAQKWDEFVSDGWPVRARWGEILSYQILIHDFDKQFESEAEIVWSLKATTLLDESAPFTATPDTGQSPADIIKRISSALAYIPIANPQISSPGFSTALDLLPEISDDLHSIVRNLNAPFATLYDITSALSDFETATSSDLRKITSSVQLMRTSILQLRDTTDWVCSQSAYMNQLGASDPTSGIFDNASAVTSMGAEKVQNDAASATLLALLADLDLECQKRLRGTSTKAHQAQDGSTWESIAKATTGSADNAQAIKQMNGVRHGAKPQAGKIYSIPRV